MAGSRDIAMRWCALAEQRLEHLTEMFETGRWRRFHTEVAFLENIQEAKRAVLTWKALATGDAPALSPTGPFSLGWSPQAASPRQPVQPIAVQPVVMPAAMPVLAAQPEIMLPRIVPDAVQIAPEMTEAVELDFEAVLDDLTEFMEAPIARFDEPATALRERASAAPERAEFTLNLDGIEAKYPLLRNSF